MSQIKKDVYARRSSAEKLKEEQESNYAKPWNADLSEFEQAEEQLHERKDQARSRFQGAAAKVKTTSVVSQIKKDVYNRKISAENLKEQEEIEKAEKLKKEQEEIEQERKEFEHHQLARRRFKGAFAKVKANTSVVAQIQKGASERRAAAQQAKEKQEAEIAEKARKVKAQRELREAASKVR